MLRSLKKYEIGGEEIILGLVIILQFLDFFEIIGSTGDYIKKIISWAALGYLLYKIKPSKLFVGVDSRLSDKILIFGYFFLTIKNLVSYAQSEINHTSVFLHDFFNFLLTYSQIIETGGIYFGLVLLVFISLRLALGEFKKPSIVNIFHLIDQKPEDFKTLSWRFLKVFLIVFGFFVIFFNLIMEWLAIAIDAPLLMIGLSSYLLISIRHVKGFSLGKLLAKFGDFGSNLYINVLKNLRYKKTFLKSVVAMIILHVITDAYTFILPFLLGFGDNLYRGIIPKAHLSFLTLFSNQISSLSLSYLDSISLLLIYFGNVVALLFFLLFPVYLWFAFFKDKIFHPRKIFLSIIIFSLSTFFFSPIFEIKPLLGLNIVGVDILGTVSSSTVSFSLIVLISFAIGLFIEFFSSQISHERIVLSGLIIVSSGFLFFYLLGYLISLSQYMVSLIQSLFLSQSWILVLFFSFIYLFLIIFYFVGFGGFVFESYKLIKREFVLIKKKL